MIEVVDLVKRHGALEVLRGVSLSVEKGRTAVIIGPSGSGKSTLLRCLNGLDSFQGGRVAIGDLRIDAGERGRDWARRHRALCRRVGMVFQGFNLFPHRSAIENVMEGPRYVLGMSRDEAETRARALLDQVGMSTRSHAMPRQLSGGQQQRVAIARALAMSPQAILFDEPTSALDPRSTAEVLAVMADLARSGLTMIVVTHAMAFARQAADVVHVLIGGQVAESGPPAQIFDAPSHAATRGLLADFQAA